VTGLIAETSGWERFAKSEAELRNAVGRYARLMHKADKGRLQGNELDQLLLTALNIRNEARELGLTGWIRDRGQPVPLLLVRQHAGPPPE
jgi:hypothetical protein